MRILQKTEKQLATGDIIAVRAEEGHRNAQDLKYLESGPALVVRGPVHGEVGVLSPIWAFRVQLGHQSMQVDFKGLVIAVGLGQT